MTSWKLKKEEKKHLVLMMKTNLLVDAVWKILEVIDTDLPFVKVRSGDSSVG